MPRHFDERVMLANPWLRRRLFRAGQRLPPGAPFRRRALKRAAVRGWAAVARGDDAAGLMMFAPDYELNVFGDGLLALGIEPHYRSHGGMLEFMDSWRSAWEEIDYDVHEVIDLGDRIVIRFTAWSRGLESGVNVKKMAGAIYYPGDEAIVRQDFYFDWDECARALGLGESSRGGELDRDD